MPERTLGQSLAEYMERLKTDGKSDRTIYTYRKDAEQIAAFFEADRKLASILTPHGQVSEVGRAHEAAQRTGEGRAHGAEDRPRVSDVPVLGAGAGVYRKASAAQACPEPSRRGRAAGPKH